MYNKYPRVCIIGDTGDGKTTAMTALALMYEKQGKRIFSNYTLYGVDYTHVEPEDLVRMFFEEDPDLYDCVIITDEAHIDLGKYSFFADKVKAMGEFATQTRKRRIIWLMTTQVFTNIVKTIRDLTTNFIYCSQVQDDYFKLELYNRSTADNGYIKTLYLHGKPFYDRFDTEEIIKKSM